MTTVSANVVINHLQSHIEQVHQICSRWTGFVGWIHARPEPLYFWFYFVVINGIWVVIPGIIAIASSAKLCHAVAMQDR